MTKHIPEESWLSLISVYTSYKFKNFKDFYDRIISKEIPIDRKTHEWLFDKDTSYRTKSQRFKRQFDQYKIKVEVGKAPNEAKFVGKHPELESEMFKLLKNKYNVSDESIINCDVNTSSETNLLQLMKLCILELGQIQSKRWMQTALYRRQKFLQKCINHQSSIHPHNVPNLPHSVPNLPHNIPNVPHIIPNPYQIPHINQYSGNQNVLQSFHTLVAETMDCLRNKQIELNNEMMQFKNFIRSIQENSKRSDINKECGEENETSLPKSLSISNDELNVKVHEEVGGANNDEVIDLSHVYDHNSVISLSDTDDGDNKSDNVGDVLNYPMMILGKYNNVDKVHYYVGKELKDFGVFDFSSEKKDSMIHKLVYSVKGRVKHFVEIRNNECQRLRKEKIDNDSDNDEPAGYLNDELILFWLRW